jgi:nucleoside-diphosphate-sugar epimerase
MGERVFPTALANKAVQLLGNLDLLHSYTYIGDVARGLATLGEQPQALGHEWLLPVAQPVTQRDMARLIGEVLGRPVRILRLPKLAIRAFGLFDAEAREFTEMFYQYTEPRIVVSQAFERAFGSVATPLDEAIRATVQWYQQRTAPAQSFTSATS